MTYVPYKNGYKRREFFAFVGGGAVSAVSGAVANIQRGAEVRDNQLKALYGVETYQTIAKNKDMLQDIKGKGMPSISVGIGSSSYASNSVTETTEARGSAITAGNDVNITTKKDIQIHGSDVVGKDVTLKAGDDIKITAATQTSTNTTNQNSKSGSIGVTFSPAGNGIYANASKGSGHENETITTHRGSTVAAGSTLTMESGKDTDITGSKAGGNKVTINAGGNLHVESQQDKDVYTEKTAGKGIGIGANTSGQGAGSMGLSGGSTRGDTHSNYEGVTSHAGIYAGNEGFDINVKGNTDLKGAVIDSNAPAEKNKLTTGTLTWEDQQNKADYKASGAGVSYAGKDAPLNAKGLTPSIAPTVKGNADSTTKSAVAEGTVTITNTKDQKQNVSDLNRDTKNALNKLHDIFDKDKVQEKQEFIGLLTKDVNEAIHKVADKNNWADGSKEKTALHALASGILAEMSGAGFSSGALAGGVNEYVIGYLSRTKGEEWMVEHPDEVQWLSTIIGGAVNQAIGGDVSTGAGSALSGTKWNEYQNISSIKEKLLSTIVDNDYKNLKDGELQTFWEEENMGKDQKGVAIDKWGNVLDITSVKGHEEDGIIDLNGIDSLRSGGKVYSVDYEENGTKLEEGRYITGENDGLITEERFFVPTIDDLLNGDFGGYLGYGLSVGDRLTKSFHNQLQKWGELGEMLKQVPGAYNNILSGTQLIYSHDRYDTASQLIGGYAGEQLGEYTIARISGFRSSNGLHPVMGVGLVIGFSFVGNLSGTELYKNWQELYAPVDGNVIRSKEGKKKNGDND